AREVDARIGADSREQRVALVQRQRRHADRRTAGRGGAARRDHLREHRRAVLGDDERYVVGGDAGLVDGARDRRGAGHRHEYRHRLAGVGEVGRGGEDEDRQAAFVERRGVERRGGGGGGGEGWVWSEGGWNARTCR